MNSCDFIGRLTRDPEVRYTQGEKPIAVARFTLAVDKNTKEGGATFLTFKALGNRGEFAEKYLKKGQQIGVHCRADAGSYDKNGSKVYYTEFIVEDYTFCGTKGSSAEDNNMSAPSSDDFMNIPEGFDEELPFN